MCVVNGAARNYRLLVFDWDGTLMDSIATIVACTQAALADAGSPGLREAIIRQAVGMGLRESAEFFFPAGTAAQQRTMIERYRYHWLETYKDKPMLFAGAAAALADLAARGHLLAIATAKGRSGLQRELDSTGIGAVVHGSRTVDECPPKPHPGMLQDLMAEFGAQPEQTLMIGDTSYDLEMAANAGVASVGVLSGSHAEAELLRLRPLALLAGVAEVPNWLRRAPASS
jgi:phosphoglycolate phosphatase